MATELTAKNFTEVALRAQEPVLLDFYADWCMPCRMQSLVIDEVEETLGDVKVCKVNVDQSPELAKEYEIRSIPTLIVLRDGEVVERISGVQSREMIQEMLVPAKNA